MAGTWLQRRATATRVSNVATIRGYDLDPPTDDLRLMDLCVEVDADGGSVDLHVMGSTGDWILAASGITNNQQVIIEEHGVALRATWTGGTVGTMEVYASPKFNGAL